MHILIPLESPVLFIQKKEKRKKKETYIIHHEAIQLQLLADRLVSFYNEKTNVEESCTPGGRHNAYTPPRWETSQDPNGSSCGA